MKKLKTEQEIADIMNPKIVELFYKLLEMTPFKVINLTEYFYKLNGDEIRLYITSYKEDDKDESFGYKSPKYHSYRDFFFMSFANNNINSDFINFNISFPNGRQLQTPKFDKQEIWDIKAKLALTQERFELSLLDKYFIKEENINSLDINIDDLPL